jgi:hypothetical protein
MGGAGGGGAADPDVELVEVGAGGDLLAEGVRYFDAAGGEPTMTSSN